MRYTVTFRITGEYFAEESFAALQYKAGEQIAAPAAPAHEGYTFSGWQNLPETMPEKDLVVTGSYTKDAGEPEQPEETPTPTPVPAFDFTQPAPETAAVEDSWFSDAVFIGDSRTDGLRLYSGIRDADFLAYKSLMIFHVVGNDRVDQKAVPLNGVGDKKTVLEWLDEKQYAKVYLMFGVNELGYGDDGAFTDAFSRTVDEIRARQPEAVIYIQSLVPIEPEKAHKTNPASWLNNDNVARYNGLLRQVCADKGVVYVDVAAALVN